MYAQHIGVVAADALRRVQMSVSGLIKGLVDYARRNLELDELDMTYKTNEVLDILGWPTFDENAETYYVTDINEALAKFTDECVDEGIFAREDAAAVWGVCRCCRRKSNNVCICACADARAKKTGWDVCTGFTTTA